MTVLSRCLLILGVMLASACAQQPAPFTPPAERPTPANEAPWPKNHFLGIAYHDVEDRDPDQAVVAVRTERLIEQLAWLRENGYKAVSVDQILAARNGGPELPPKAIMLSFDDGYSSFYTRVMPILRAYRWPALLAPVGYWIDTPMNQPVDFAGQPRPRGEFLTWQQIREVSQSGLVEIAAHTDNNHKGILANPQGNLEPAATSLRFDPATGRYESQAQFDARMRADVAAISNKIQKVTGKKPRVWVWPYGAAKGTSLAIIGEQGYQMALTLEDGLDSSSDLMNSPRFLVASDPDGEHFANSMVAVQTKAPMRVLHVDLDNVYDPDPVQQARNLDQLVQRVVDMGAGTVFLQAFADPKGDGLVHSLYFPNRHLPVRADLFNRVSWQLHTRAHASGEELHQLRPYRAGDAPRSISWKHSARRDSLLVREYEKPVGIEVILDWRALAPLGHEARIARLARWVDVAEREGRRYTLLLPAHPPFGPGQGASHHHLCLRALALMPHD